MNIKNIFQKLVLSVTAATMALGGALWTPALAMADNGLHIGVGADSKNNVKFGPLHMNVNVGANANANANNNDDMDDQVSQMDTSMQTNVNADNSLNIQDNMFISAMHTARAAFKDSVKEANEVFKDAKQDARVDLKTAVDASVNETDRLAAVKAYLTTMLSAFKTRAASIEAAFQAFINATH